MHTSPSRSFLRFRLVAALTAALLSLSRRASAADEAPSPASPPAPTAKDATDDEKRGAQEEHDAWRLGAIAGVGFPHPLAVEAMLKIEDYVAVGLEYGVLPKTTIAGVDVQLQAVSADLRVFPFRGVFFVGMRAGHQTAEATTTVRVATVSTTQSVDMNRWFINPRLGILWTSRPGFTLGTELGLQIPVGAKTNSTVPTAVASATNLTSTAQTFSETVLPTVDLIRAGWLF